MAAGRFRSCQTERPRLELVQLPNEDVGESTNGASEGEAAYEGLVEDKEKRKSAIYREKGVVDYEADLLDSPKPLLVDAVPRLILFKNSENQGQITGTDATEFEEFVNNNISV